MSKSGSTPPSAPSPNDDPQGTAQPGSLWRSGEAGGQPNDEQPEFRPVRTRKRVEKVKGRSGRSKRSSSRSRRERQSFTESTLIMEPGYEPGSRKRSRPKSASLSFRKRRRRRRFVLFSLLGFGLLVAAAGAVLVDAYYQSVGVYRDARQVLPSLDRARAFLARGLIPPGDPFQQASLAADKAQRDIDDARFTFRLVGGIPFFRRPIDAVKFGVRAATEEAAAATGMRDMVRDVLGPAALSGSNPGTTAQGTEAGKGSEEATPIFKNGVANVALIKSLTPRLEAVIGHLEAGDRAVRAIPSVPFVHRLAALKADAIAQSDQAIALARNALSSARLLPGFLGADGARTYLVALQNNADLRGPGGEMAAYALISVNRGRLSLVGGGGVHDIRVNEFNSQIYVRLSPAVQWFVANVPHNFSWINGVNYSPNFPDVAATWSRMAQKALGREVDGVIALDPIALSDLMGRHALHTPFFDYAITAKNVVSVMENKQYFLPIRDQMAFPALLIKKAFPIFTGLHPFVRAVKQYGVAFRTKHMQVWSAHPDERELIERLGWDAGMKANPGDYLYMVDNKIIPNKVDFYTHSRIDYAVTVLESGTVRSTCTVTLDNRTPEGLPGSIRGSPHHGAGLNRALISLYAPERARATSLSPATGLPTHVERDWRVFTRTLEVEMGRTATARYVYTVPRAIAQSEAGRVYQLTVQHQPLVNPTELYVTVTLPKGTEVKSFGPGWTALGNVAKFHATLTRDLVTRIVF